MADTKYFPNEAQNILANNQRPLTATHATASMGTASSAVLAANVNRRYAMIQNDSDSPVYISMGTAVLNQGIRLAASGGSYEISGAKGNLFTGAFAGISSAASKLVLVLEAS